MTSSDTPVVTFPPTPDVVVDNLKDLVSSSYLNHESTAVQIRAGALFARLKALNRSASVATRAHKQATADARHEMDQTYLSLQNFQYEKRHLEREIDKCRQFACVSFSPPFPHLSHSFLAPSSVYQDIPLYSLEEYIERAPDNLRSDDALSNEHTLMLNRLNFELSERQRQESRPSGTPCNKMANASPVFFAD